MSALDGLAAALGILRKRRRMTQAAVEKAAGLASGTLSRYERAEKEPRLETLGRILDVLGADLYDLGLEARRAAGGATVGNGDAATGDPRIALIDRYAREIGLDALAEVARRERGALVEAAVRRLNPTSTGGAAE